MSARLADRRHPEEVSRTVDGGALPFRIDGVDRRLRRADALACRDRQDGTALAVLDELTRLAEDLGLDA